MSTDKEKLFQRHVMASVISEDCRDPDYEDLRKPGHRQELSRSLRETYPESTQEFVLALSPTELDELSIATAIETVEIRTLIHESCEGKLSLEELRAHQLYPIYQDYFDRTPEGLLHIHLISQAVGLALRRS
jgi:hypothetical protein